MNRTGGCGGTKTRL